MYVLIQVQYLSTSDILCTYFVLVQYMYLIHITYLILPCTNAIYVIQYIFCLSTQYVLIHRRYLSTQNVHNTMYVLIQIQYLSTSDILCTCFVLIQRMFLDILYTLYIPCTNTIYVIQYIFCVSTSYVLIHRMYLST